MLRRARRNIITIHGEPSRVEKMQVNRLAARLLVGGLLALGCAGCAWLRDSEPPPAPQVVDDIARDVSVAATPFHRLIVNAAELDNTSRLVVFYVRIETAAESFRIRSVEMTLDYGDGTSGIVFDRERARALLERTDLLILDADATVRDPAGYDRTAAYQQELRRMILEELLDEGEVRRDQPLRGYVVLDTRRSYPSFEGTSFYIQLTRVDDGAQLRQFHRFPEAAVASTATPTDQAHQP
jgi:hypothetical protein